MKTLLTLLFSLFLMAGMIQAKPMGAPENPNEGIVHGTTIKIMAHANDEYIHLDKSSVKAAANWANSHRLVIEKVSGREGDGLHNGDTFVLRSADGGEYFHTNGNLLVSGASEESATHFVIEKPGRESAIHSGDRVKIRSVEGDKYWSLHEKSVRWHGNRMEAHLFVMLID